MKQHQYLKMVVLGWMLVWGAGTVQGQFSGGSGTVIDPYLISTAADMQTLSANQINWEKHFQLTSDLYMTGVAITPIGNNSTKFTGTFDGDDYTIANLTMDFPAVDYVGLFGYVDSDFNPSIFNLGLIDPDVTGKDYVGPLVGRQFNGHLYACYAQGGSVKGNWRVGGLVGNSTEKISTCYATVSVDGVEFIGGLIGQKSAGTISDCYANGSVTGTNSVGGLLGYNSFGSINDCYASCAVSGTSNVGGLVGFTFGSASTNNSFWDKQISGLVNSAGGTGKTTAEMQMIATFTTAGWDFYDEATNGTEDIWVMCVDGVDTPRLTLEMPGPIGYGGGSGSIADPYLISVPSHLQRLSALSCDWDKHFKLTADLDLNGVAMTLIGYYNSFTNKAAFSGTFDGDGHTITNLSINLPTTIYVGLFGWVDSAFDPTIFNLGLINPEITGKNLVGALAGRLETSTLWACFADGGSVNGVDWVGGLVGWNNNGTIINSNASCTVNGRNRVGGLVGIHITGTISDSYAAGHVNGSTYVGGLVGWNDSGTITKCYAADAVNGTNNVGGLVGLNSSGTINNSFWDTQTTVQTNSAGGTGKTTAQMKEQATFSGWDFVSIWGIFEKQTYPLLKGIPLCIQDGTGYPPGDNNGDCRFDMLDFAFLVQFWLADRSWQP